MLTAWRVTDFLANERTIDFLGDHDAGSADGDQSLHVKTQPIAHRNLISRSLKKSLVNAGVAIRTMLAGSHSTSVRPRLPSTV